ncbi:sigma-70 family RNA polymerase sigma factor, partial [Streptomyces sp. NPDC059766]|uniref:sigma-70 family RNA polymerase sigma factor n=1 Tax=Streptomyces sp. NPDC059766 TaxID=3346940 RepID=UPI00366A4AA6
MTGTHPAGPIVDAYESHRDRLRSVAYRMLGSHADTEDAVQEAWLRLSRQDTDAIDDFGGWLTIVVGRISLDVLRSGRTRPEVSFDDRLTEFTAMLDDAPAPEDVTAIADFVGLALLTILDLLRPDERLTFVLHDVSAAPFTEIGTILDKFADATKMLASRARRKVQGAQQPTSTGRRQRDVVQAFLAAARDGRCERLLQVPYPEVKFTVHTPNGTFVTPGATEVASRARVAGSTTGGDAAL